MAEHMRKSSADQPAKPAQEAPPQAVASPPPVPDDRPVAARRVVVDVAQVDFGVSEKWRERLRQLDDYQRSAPFVLGRVTLS
jgi:hypothetical protein